jgi:hypothetical protein
VSSSFLSFILPFPLYNPEEESRKASLGREEESREKESDKI